VKSRDARNKELTKIAEGVKKGNKDKELDTTKSEL